MRPFWAVSIAYLLGSIPTGFLIVRAKEGGDIRKTGSGGTGATNVSRRAGKLAGVVTLLFDVLKGLMAMLLAKELLGTVEVGSGRWGWAMAGVAVVVGHIFPVWLKFRGGKGVATSIGVFLMLSPWSLLIASVVFLAIVLVTRYVSLASMVAALTVPLTMLMLGRESVVSRDTEILAATCIAALVVFAHRGNIQRLRNGTENKFR